MKKSNLKWSLIAAFMLVATPIVSNAMHVMEGFLPVKWAIIWWVIFIPFFVVGLKNITRIVKDQPKKKLLLALCGAFVFETIGVATNIKAAINDHFKLLFFILHSSPF